MKTSQSLAALPPLSRRQFLKSSGLAVVAGTLAAPEAAAQSRTPETLRVGLIGCGGRGTGAAAQALAADPNVRLVALGDAFQDRLQGSLATLKKQPEISGKIDVRDECCFVGFDAYRKVIEHSDVVRLATPPHFRPLHLQAAVAAGKHTEKSRPNRTRQTARASFKLPDGTRYEVWQGSPSMRTLLHIKCYASCLNETVKAASHTVAMNRKAGAIYEE